MKKVSIILLNYNGYSDTISCFESIKKINYPNYEIIIVDNNSPDNSMAKILNYMSEKKVDYIEFKSPNDAMQFTNNLSRTILIQSGNNYGYGHGNNIGIKYALSRRTDYVLILNNDTIVKPDFLQPMVDMCEKDRNIGIASGKIFFYDKPDIIWFNGGKFSPCMVKTEHFNFNEKDIHQTQKETVTFISGCMWLIPSRIFEIVGFINEDYFMYVEDIEFCQRIIHKKYKLKIENRSHIFHKVGASNLGQLSAFSVFYRAKNKRKFIFDNLKNFCKIRALLNLIFLESIRYIYKKRLDLLVSHIKGVFRW